MGSKVSSASGKFHRVHALDTIHWVPKAGGHGFDWSDGGLRTTRCRLLNVPAERTRALGKPGVTCKTCTSILGKEARRAQMELDQIRISIGVQTTAEALYKSGPHPGDADVPWGESRGDDGRYLPKEERHEKNQTHHRAPQCDEG